MCTEKLQGNFKVISIVWEFRWKRKRHLVGIMDDFFLKKIRKVLRNNNKE